MTKKHASLLAQNLNHCTTSAPDKAHARTHAHREQTWSLRDGDAGRRGSFNSQSLTKPITVVRRTTLSDFSSTSRHAAERDWKTFFTLGMAPREVMSRSSFREITRACACVHVRVSRAGVGSTTPRIFEGFEEGRPYRSLRVCVFRVRTDW